MKNKFSFFKNEVGSVLAQVMMGIVLLAGITATIYTSSLDSIKTTQQARVSSAMTLTTFQLKLFLQSSTNYYCPVAPCTAAQMRLVPNFETDVQKIVASQGLPACKNSSVCKIQIVNSSFNTDGLKTYTAVIKYFGDYSFKDLIISEIIPDSVLGGSSGLCNDLTKPLFAGYDTSGNIICNPLPQGVNNPCGSGYYISSVNNKNLQATCTPIGQTVDCSAADKVISQMNWVGGANLTYTCADRLDPFSYFGYTVVDTTVAPPVTPPVTPPPPPPVPMNGVCGSARGNSYSSPAEVNTAGLCSSGVAVPLAVTGTGPWSWSCNGVNGGTNMSCNASNAAPLCYVREEKFGCPGPIDTGPVYYSTLAQCNATSPGCGTVIRLCQDENDPVKCGPPVITNGTCGVANGQSYTTAADVNAAGLCSTGSTRTDVSGAGPWSWTCRGSGGGTNMSCGASVGGVANCDGLSGHDQGPRRKFAWYGDKGGIYVNSPYHHPFTCCDQGFPGPPGPVINVNHGQTVRISDYIDSSDSYVEWKCINGRLSVVANFCISDNLNCTGGTELPP